MAKVPKTAPLLEIEIQQAFRKRLYYTAPKVRVVAVPNAAKRSQWAIMQAKREGLSSGFPDVLCIWPGAGVAFVEFKRPGGATSPNQSEWHERLDAYGHRIFVAYGVDQAIDFLRQCGAPIMESEGLNSGRNAAQPTTPNEGTV